MLRSAPPPYRASFSDPAQQIIDAEVAALDRDLRAISVEINDNPELGFHEFRAHRLLTTFLKRKEGWTVEDVESMPTAFVATFEHREGGRTMGFNAEYDALPQIGNACGHNLIAIVGVGAALALARVLVELDIPGRVKLLGTPAEEGGGGKVIFIREGAYDDMDASMMAHPMGGRDPKDGPVWYDGGLGAMLAISGITAEFMGKTAHAGANPWDGVNALDAAIGAYNAISALRQQVPPTHRVHGVLKGTEGYAQNIIPGTARLEFGCRAPTSKEVAVLRNRVIKCFEAAALSTGCTVKVSVLEDYTYDDLHNSSTLADAYASVMEKHHGQRISRSQDSTASTDFGNVTYRLPACHPGFTIPAPPGSSNHTIGFAKAARSEEAHVASLKVATGLARVGLRVIEEKGFAKEARREFEDWKGSSS